jgi:hypothetical protein
MGELGHSLAGGGKPNGKGPSSLQIRSASGEPIDVPNGEYYLNPKARPRRMMLNSLSKDARQVYACLETMTMFFRQELAVVMEKGILRPATPTDIVQRTGLDDQRVRRGLEELEDQGLGERQADDGGALRKGHVNIYSWAEPRSIKCKEDNSGAPLESSLHFPPEWAALQPLINRWKLEFNLDESSCALLLSEGEAVARAYQEAEKLARAFLERVCAHPRPNKEEIKERNTSERNTHTEDQPSLATNGVCVSPPFDPKPTWEAFWHTYTEPPHGNPSRKDDAKDWWKAKVKTADYAAEIIEGLNAHKAGDRWSRGIGVWDAINFLDKHRYREKPPPAKPKKLSVADEVRERIRRREAEQSD